MSVDDLVYRIRCGARWMLCCYPAESSAVPICMRELPGGLLLC